MKLSIEFAGAMLANYRAAFKRVTKEDFKGDDILLLKIINDCPTYETSQDEDDVIFEMMVEYNKTGKILLLSDL